MTYFEWVQYFNKLKDSPRDEQILEFLNNSKVDYEGDIFVRFSNQIVFVIEHRLKKALNNFSDKIKRVNQTKDNIMLEVNEFKNEIIFIRKLATLKYFDENQKNILSGYVNEIAQSATNIIKSCFAGSTDNEILLIVNNINFDS